MYRTDTYFGYISERTWYINFLIEGLFIVSVLTPGFFQARLSRLQLSILLFLAVLLAADLVGVDPVQSIFSGYSRLEGFLLYLHLTLYFFALVRVPFPRHYWNRALLLAVVIAIVVVIQGYFSSTGWQPIDHRLIATVGNPSFLAVYLLLHLFLTVYLYRQFPTISPLLKGILAALAIVVLAGGVYLTGTRSAIVGLAAGSIYLAVFGLWRYYDGTFLKPVGWLALMGLGAGLLFWIARSTTLFQQFTTMYRLTHYSGDNNTLSPRIICWKIGLSGLMERPWLGWGQENFSYGFSRHYDPAILLSSGSSWYDRAHNVLIDLGFSAGILGILAYVFVCICLVRRLRTANSLINGLDRGVLWAVFVAYFCFNLFNFDSLLPLQLIFLLVAFIDASPDPASVRPVSSWVVACRTVAIGLVACLAFYSVYQPFRTLRALDRQNKLTDIQERTRALDAIYREASGYRMDMADNLASLAISVQKSDQPEPAKQFCYQQATTVMHEQLTQHPFYGRLMSRLVTLYIAGGETDKAISMCQQINRLEGYNRPPTFIQLGTIYLSKGAYPQALAAFEQARKRYPPWTEPALYKALTFAVRGDTTRCYQFLRAIDTRTLVNRLLFIKQIYTQAGNRHQFLQRIMETERKDPFTPDVYVEWAMTAFDLNDRFQLTTAINSFYNMYFRNRRDYQEFKELIEGGQRGIRPDRLAELAKSLSP